MIIVDDLLEVAKALAKNSDEANLRSSVSRAYYAAFHEASQYAHKKHGYTRPRNQSAHSSLARHLIDCKKDEVRQAGISLQNLHIARKLADYDLNDDLNENDAKLHVMMAETLIMGFRKG
ncbi:MAG: hypothetical protein Q9M26_04510 [Mariprofundales bacterium]|nr:hypothetical protein [Mariprofundales bacterium]